MDEQHLKDLEKKTKDFLEKKAKKPELRKVSRVLEEDQTLRPYSVRLSTKELLEIKLEARTAGLSTSEFVRRLLLEGLEKTKAGTATILETDQLLEVVNEIRDVLSKIGVVPPLSPRITLAEHKKKRAT